MLIKIMILSFFGFIYRDEVAFSSPLGSASSSDNSLLEDPFSIKYVLRDKFICVRLVWEGAFESTWSSFLKLVSINNSSS